MFRFAATVLLLPVAFTLFVIVIVSVAVAAACATMLDGIEAIWPEEA